MRIDHHPEAPSGPPRGLFQDTVDGFVYSWNNRAIRLLLLLAVVSALLLRPIIDLMPAFVGDVLEQGPVTLAWLLSSTGATALAASLWLARRNNTDGLTRYMLAASAASAITIFAFAWQTNLVLGVVLMAVFGFTMSVMNVSNMSLVQIGLEDRMRARVMGTYSLSFRLVPAVGALIVGTSGTLVSLPVPVSVAAALSLLFWVWMVRAVGRQDLEVSPAVANQV